MSLTPIRGGRDTVTSTSQAAYRRRPPFWFSFNVELFEEKTFDLGPVETSAYVRLLVAYWRNQGPLPDNDELLARLARLDERCWSKVRPIIASKFDVVWVDLRMEEQIAAARDRSDRNRRNRAGGRV
ncbi:MAG: DUF1376 domain-containing protein [Anaerolineae bacterium]|nr:DUF1376 domain-containing protein [Anaerolineae bacterium]